MAANSGIEHYRRAGRAAAAARDHGISLLKVGAPLLDIAEEVESRVIREGAQLAFPVNISINEVAAHFTPLPGEKKRLEAGMLVKLDVGAHVEGCIGDTAATAEVGAQRWASMVRAADSALSEAVALMRPNLEMRHVGGAIERTISAFGFKPVSNLTGHSLSPYALHGGVSVPNVMDGTTDFLREGDAVAVEPFATNGAGRVKSGKTSNIYRLLREPTEKDLAEFPLLAHISREYRSLPFAERWCARADDTASKQLARLARKGLITYYPMLVEAGGGMVSQAEHTLVLTAKGAEVTTR